MDVQSCDLRLYNILIGRPKFEEMTDVHKSFNWFVLNIQSGFGLSN